MRKRYQHLLVLIVLICACSSLKVDNKVVESSPLADSVNLFGSADTFMYVGFLNRYYFQKTDEFYVELYFLNDSYTEKEYFKISNSADSLIFKDDENRRSRIPLNIAKKEFDLRGLKTLSLFNQENEFLTKAHFVRVEFLDQPISPVFTAVYKSDTPKLTEKAIYCIGNLQENIHTDRCRSFEDTLLTKDIEQKLKLTHQFTFDGKNYLYKEQNLFSIINLDTIALIVEKRNDVYTPIYKSSVSENILEIVFVPVIINSHPLILTKSIIPETDIEWNYLLVFDGEHYKPSDRQRVKK